MEETPNGFLDLVEFKTYDTARIMLRDLGWRESARSVPKDSSIPSSIEYFNCLIGGTGFLYPMHTGVPFFALEGWLGKVLKKKQQRGELKSPTEEARIKAALETAKPKEDGGSIIDLFS